MIQRLLVEFDRPSPKALEPTRSRSGKWVSVVGVARGSTPGVDMAVTCQVSYTRPVLIVVSARSPFLSPRSSIVPAARCVSDG